MVLTAFAMVALVGCNGGGSGGLDAATPNGPATTTSTGASSAAPLAPMTDPVKMRAAMLSLEDLPSDWLSHEFQTLHGPDSICGIPTDQLDRLIWARAEFTKGKNAPVLQEFLASYRAGTGKQNWDDAIEALRDCAEYRRSNDVDAPYVFTILPVAFPQLGDDTFAYRIDGPPNYIFVVETIQVRYGDVIMSIVYLTSRNDSIDPSFTEEMARKADAHLRNQ